MKPSHASVAALLLAASSVPSSADATEFSTRMFGHEVVIAPKDDEERLTVDGRELLKNRYVMIQEIGVIAGVPVAIGTSSNGGNACGGATFVVSFPRGAAARLDGPLDECLGMDAEMQEDRIDLSTMAVPGRDGERWTWTPELSFRSAGKTAFKADEGKGWAQLRERTADHPSDLMDYAEIGRRITQLAGPDKELVLRILTGVGSAEFKGDWLIGVSCTPHMCTEEEALVAASLNERQIYLAWKPQGQKIVVRPPVGNWPEKAKGELREWAAKWK